jgi:hypothetical protein
LLLIGASSISMGLFVVRPDAAKGVNMSQIVTVFLIVLAIFIALFAISLDDTRVYISKIAKVILIVMVICCLMACFIFFNYCQFFHDGFC